METNWISLLVSWLPFIALILVWIVLSRWATTKRPWGRIADMVTEMRRMNGLLERIAVATEQRAEK